MSNTDRRHAIEVAQRYLAHRPAASRDEVAAVLLHDVGKLASSLGVTGRVAATVVGPRGPRFRAYHDHEPIGAEMCERAGSTPVTVAMVGGRAGTELMAALRRADHV